MCTALRAAGVTIPIFAVTGNVDPVSVEVFKRSGFDGLAAKPYSIEDVAQLIARARWLLERPAPAAGAPREWWSTLAARGDTGSCRS